MTSLGRRQVVLFEPLLRGSRLQLVANVIFSLRELAHVTLVTRKDYRTPHFIELIEDAGLVPDIVTAESDLDGAWMRNLSLHEFRIFFDEVEEIDRKMHASNSEYDLVFMALDDYLLAYLSNSSNVRSLSKATQIFCLKYRTEYLFHLTSGLKFRGLILRAMTQLGLFISGARLIGFDERLVLRKVSNVAGVIPDPWFGDFSARRRQEGRAKLAISNEAVVYLALGKQDRRKGIDFLIGAFPTVFETSPYACLAVVGRIDEKYSAQFEALKLRFPDRIVHIDYFVPEADLPAYFSAADFFLVPYNTDFTATSGTLSRAAASGVPVIATAHGLVGYRVKTYSLGVVFEHSNKESFMKAVTEGLDLRSRNSESLEAATARFADATAITSFRSSVQSVFNVNSRAVL